MEGSGVRIVWGGGGVVRIVWGGGGVVRVGGMERCEDCVEWRVVV